MPRVQISEKWTGGLAYIIGLITSDGCLSKDGRHIDFTSKDLDQIQNFTKILGLNNKIGIKKNKLDETKNCFRVQFGNVRFYRFLLTIGLSPNKSKIIKSIKVPEKYFKDFLRGLFDGDGFSFSYWDKQWKTSFRLYCGFVSASRRHLEWLQSQISNLYGINGKIGVEGRTAYQLRFAKKSSIQFFKILYYKGDLICLYRKKYKFEQSLCIIEKQKQAGVAKLVDARD